jgi:uncharacterized protein (DUF488 family)
MNQTNLYTIGFTQKSAEAFFSQLANAGVRRVIDVRLNNRSQLAGFAKQDDLKYFLRAIAGIEYVHVPLLAPEKDMLNSYKKHGGEWATYEKQFLDLIAHRKIESELTPELFQESCLLCSEHKPHHCHRRLVAEYLREKWDNTEIKHLV